MTFNANKVAHSIMLVPRSVGQVFQTMTDAHVGFVRGQAMTSQRSQGPLRVKSRLG